MPKMLDKVCLNHTSVRAVSRCETCFRPLCAQCIIDIRGRHYCSERCAGNSDDKRGRLDAYEAAGRRTRAARFVKKLVGLLILAGIAAAAFFYWQGHKKEVNNMLNSKEVQSALKTVEKKAAAVKKEAVAVKDTVVKKATLPTPSSNNAIRARQKLD